ncbi:DUF4221 family protein [Cyclobacterium sp. 1_MG-2023]|uniref:DUF4221 family protein n=1 Tax=Cyclobacterium sp. 1_MG-2023 TaxID=3062681 RepID=UPI0026E3099F|nr:DUF4221 family protein [Cyclobacterium sp. 1_MG-2023]MDO6438906.1 DUF4221 family protein [Cyclobacterium sp. 1_MG-2023]
MKSSYYCLFFTFIFACNGSNEKTNHDLQGFEITSDTVIVDPGQEILFLTYKLGLSTLSEDKKYLYNFNNQDFAIEQINLNTLKFEKKYPFEKEGPNGVGEYLMDFSLIDNNQIFFRTFTGEGIFDWQGNKLESFNLANMGEEKGLLEETDRAYKILSFSPEGKKFVSLITNYQSKTNALAIIDREHQTFEKHAIPAVDKASDFEVFLNDGKSAFGFGAYRFLIQEGANIILGTNVSNELYVVHQKSDSLQLLSFKSDLTPNQKSGTYPAESSDIDEFRTYRQKIQEDINFREPYWDEKKQVYYRISYHTKFDENAEIPEGGMFPSPSGVKAFLSILDKDLTLIKEGEFPQLNRVPEFHFAKDGKLWLFENIEDEMGFVRFDINW